MYKDSFHISVSVAQEIQGDLELSGKLRPLDKIACTGNYILSWFIFLVEAFRSLCRGGLYCDCYSPSIQKEEAWIKKKININTDGFDKWKICYIHDTN